MKIHNGFTLIELLVVVLIIGILAAIALPQYTKTVEKSKMAEAVTNLSALENAVNRLVLERGSVPDEYDAMELLDISVPAETKNFKYFATCESYRGCELTAESPHYRLIISDAGASTKNKLCTLPLSGTPGTERTEKARKLCKLAPPEYVASI